MSVEACSQPFAYTNNADDCDDTDASLNPADADSDGYSTCDNDCDDSESTINPNQFEACDGLDNNCDGVVDEGVKTMYYADLDQDGYGDPNVSVEGAVLLSPTSTMPMTVMTVMRELKSGGCRWGWVQHL